MTDFERIEQLADKLGHSMSNIRCRAAHNLLSKVQSGIIPHRLLSTPHCAEVIATGITKCVKLLCHDFSSSDRDESSCSTRNETLSLLLQFIKYVGSSSVASSSLAFERYSEVLDGLYSISSCEDQISDAVMIAIEQVALIIYSVI